MSRNSTWASSSSASSGTCPTRRSTRWNGSSCPGGPGGDARHMIVDVHTHFYPRGDLDILERGPEPYAIGRDAEGRTILTLHGARIVTMTRAMTSPDERVRDTDGLRADPRV